MAIGRVCGEYRPRMLQCNIATGTSDDTLTNE